MLLNGQWFVPGGAQVNKLSDHGCSNNYAKESYMEDIIC